MTTTNIAIVGLGTVGTGVIRILNRHGEAFARRTGSRIVVKHVVVRDAAKQRDVELPNNVITKDAARAISDPEVSVVVEVMGGIDTASAIVRQAMSGHKSIVTANKALIAEQGPDLFHLASAHDVSIAFDAAVAGGIPIVTNVMQCLAANRIRSIRGILNGTCNYMLTQMEEHSCAYGVALADAQHRGFAEADPSMDVDGTDAAQKLAILAQLGLATRVDWRQIPRLGIQHVGSADVSAARELGYRIRLLAVAAAAEQDAGKVSLHVAPTLVPVGSSLAEVRGPDNAICIGGDAVGELFFQGAGAGQLPTASAVVADLLDTVSGRAQLTFRHLQNLELTGKMSDPAQMRGRYYLRLRTSEEPGVLGDLAKVMVRHDISVATVLQREVDKESSEPGASVVVISHPTREGAINQAIKELEAIPTIHSPITKMRVGDTGVERQEP